MNHKHTHPHPPTRQLVQQFFCTYFMLISKTVLHSLHGQFEIYDEYSDCCYGFPASKIYYAYCVGWGFLTSAQTAILGWIIPCWGGGKAVPCLVECSAASPALPTRFQEHLPPSPLSCDNQRWLQPVSNVPSGAKPATVENYPCRPRERVWGTMALLFGNILLGKAKQEPPPP